MEFSSGQLKKEMQLIETISHRAVEHVLRRFEHYTKGTLKLSKESKEIIDKEFTLLKERFFDSMYMSLELAHKAKQGNFSHKERIAYFNEQVHFYKNKIKEIFPQAANIWILDGIIIKNQTAGIKRLFGLPEEENAILDVLGSASSISLGAENPWLIMMDRIEDHLGIRDNVCTPYHTGIRQGFALQTFAEYYPSTAHKDNLVVHMESSGTIVNSLSIESAIAYVEKRNQSHKMLRMLAVDGTWAGGYGTAREATGFGVDTYPLKRTGKNVWIDRCLPAPIAKHKDAFFSTLHEKLESGEVAGLYIEPDVIGDLGMIEVDRDILEKIKELLKQHNLPIILDCVQQYGRSGSLWGENVDLVFHDYPLLIVTAAKSSSNGQPFAYTIMPKEISDAAAPLSQLTTNQMNGPLLRSLVVAEMFRDSDLQKWMKSKSLRLEEICASYGIEKNVEGLRGKYLNRGIYVGENEMVKLMQLALFMEDGILIGSLPQSIRYQPMVLEFSETNELLTEVICKRIQAVHRGEISDDVKKAYEAMQHVSTGLAID